MFAIVCGLEDVAYLLVVAGAHLEVISQVRL